MPSDYTKDETGEYIYLNFDIAASPNNFEYDKETSTLEWNANSNPDGTKYFVLLNDENMSGENGTTNCFFNLDFNAVGEYSVVVEALPADKAGYTPYSAQSEEISFTRLATPVLNFNNGILSWPAMGKEAYFELTLTSITNPQQPAQIFETEQNSYNFSFVNDVGNYTVSVRAIGNLANATFPLTSTENYSLDGIGAVIEFTKLATTGLQYNETNNTFSVLNSGGHNVVIIFTNVATGQKTQRTIVGGAGEIAFDMSDFELYSVEAKILVNVGENQIEGNLSECFCLASDQNAQLKRIQKIQAPEMTYNESGEISYIGFLGSADPLITYRLLKGGESVGVLNDNAFNLGNTAEVFTNSGTYEFKLTVDKEIQNQTIFLTGETALNVEKLEAPTGVALTQDSTADNLKIEIKDDTADASKINESKIFINGITTTILNSQQNDFAIRAVYSAITGYQTVNGIKTFFTSSDELNCSLERLTAPTGLTFDYTTKQFSWVNATAEKFAIYIDGTFNSETSETQFKYLAERAYTFSVYALPQAFAQIGEGESKFVASSPTTLEVYKSSSVSGLYFTLDETSGLVSVHWSAPTGLPAENNARYDVFVDDASVLGGSLLTQTTFEFSASEFDTAGEYVVGVKVKDSARSSGGEFFESEILNISLTRLSAISKINLVVNSEQTSGTISAVGYEVAKMKRLKVKLNDEIAEYHNGNSYVFSELNDGDILNLEISYGGIFDSVLGKYFLDSAPSDFTIRKLKALANINYDDGTFSWNTVNGDIYNGGVNAPFEFRYYTSAVGGGSPSAETATTELQATISDLTSDFEFWIYEASILSGQIFNSGETVYLNSSKVFFPVTAENQVSNLKMEYTTVNTVQKILLSWNFTALYPEISVPMFSLKILESENIVLEIPLTATEIYTGADNLYSYIIDLENFINEGDYTVSVVAYSNKTLLSASQEIIITKLEKANFVNINGFNVTFMKNETDEISLNGATSIQMTGGINHTIGTNWFEIVGGIGTGQTLTVNARVLAVAPENVANGHYFLDSEQAVFVFKRLESIQPTIDFNAQRIIWEQKENTDYYSLMVAAYGPPSFIDVTDNFISFDNPLLANLITEEGVYSILVKAMAGEQTVPSNPELNPQQIAIVSGDFSAYATLEKLRKIRNITISVNDNIEQRSVVVTWGNLQPEATLYDIWISQNSESLGTLALTVPAMAGGSTFFETSTLFAEAGDYYVSIVAKGSEALNSLPSEKVKIVRLGSVEQENINISTSSILEWNETVQIASGLLDCGYYIELLNENNEIKSTFEGEAGQYLLNNILNLSDNNWLNLYQGGDFYIKIKVKGNGSSIDARGGVTTLSSVSQTLSAYKLRTPMINFGGAVEKNYLTVHSNLDVGLFPDMIDFFLTVTRDGVTLKSNERLVNSLDGSVQIGTFIIPTEWQAGIYSFQAYTEVREAETLNILKSPIFQLQVEKMAIPQSVKIEATDPLDAEQSEVRISWDAVLGASFYIILIDGEEAGETAGTSWTTQDFLQEKIYKIEIKAMRPGAIPSLSSNAVFAVRLNSIESGSVNANMEVMWDAVSQSHNGFQYCILIENSNHEIIETIKNLPVDSTEYLSADFDESTWFDWLESYIGGNYFVKIIVQGNGSSQGTTDSTATLSSEPLMINAYKFLQPNISIDNNIMTITSVDSAALAEKMQIHYKISVGEVVKAEGIYSSVYTLPNEWEVGNYLIESYVTAKTDTLNYVKSNVAKLNIEKLAAATELEITAANPDDVTQKEVKIKWKASANAEFYDIYINKEKFSTYEPLEAEDYYEITSEQIMQDAGEYEVKIISRASNFIMSNYSDSVSALRLNPVSTAHMTSDINVVWTAPEQESAEFTYYSMLLDYAPDGEIQGESTKDLTSTNYAGFASNTWLSAFEGGTFGVALYVVGNGTSSAGMATLSSEIFAFSALKLYVPNIVISPDGLELEISNASELVPLPSELSISDISGLKFSIRFDTESGAFAKDKDNIDIDNFIYEDKFFYPEEWLSGNYYFSAFNFPTALDLVNVIPSLSSTKMAERLEAPQNLKFSRPALDAESLADYSSDAGTNPEFLHESTYFAFDSVENAETYTIQNGSYQAVGQTNNILISGELEWILDQYLNQTCTLKVLAAGSGGVYINSPYSTIEFSRLDNVGSFCVNQGKINWTTSAGAFAYLIKATDIEGTVRFWQSDGASEYSSFLNGIMDDGLQAGQISFNIKALGNLTGDSGDEAIILDSSYFSADSEFFKLEEPENFKSHFGFLSCDTVENAAAYSLSVSTADDTYIASFILDDYSDRMTSLNRTFIGYSSEFYNLLIPETLYKVRIQAISEDGSQIIYSGITEPINIKILTNANAVEDICLEFNPNGMLDQTLLQAKAAARSYGLIQIGEQRITTISTETEPYITEKTIRGTLRMPNEMSGLNVCFPLSSLGSSILVDDGGAEQFYYLNSAITKSQDFHVLGMPIIRNERGEIKWDIVEGADGYYVYINGALYGNDIYTLNQLNLPAEYGNNNENTPLDLKVIAVTNSLNSIFSPDGFMRYEIIAGDLVKEFLVDFRKLKTPQIFDIVDGALVFNNGLTALNAYDRNDIMPLLTSYSTIDDYNALMQYIEGLFISPLVLYSRYLGFDLPDFEFKFHNIQTGNDYYLIMNAENLLKITASQREKFLDLRTVVLNFTNIIVHELENRIDDLLEQGGQKEEIKKTNELIDLYQLLHASMQGIKIDMILDIHNKERTGWPSLDLVFSELESTVNIPGGDYTIKVRQIGNTCDEISSNFNNSLPIFLPKAVGNVEIVELNGDFLLLWNKVEIPLGYLYSPMDTDEDGIGEKYIIYGEDAEGKRYELLRTNGIPAATENRFQINLSELLENGILTSDIIKLFIVVAGDTGDVLAGISSEDIEIAILPEVSPNMSEGVLVWDSMPSVSAYEIIASATGYETLRFEITDTFWAGEELAPEVTYNISIRAIGSVYVGAGAEPSISCVLSGLPVQFRLSKLNEMNVSVNKYGIFNWDTVANAQGFSVEIKDTDFTYTKADGFDLQYESIYEGFHNYLFKALGTTGSINLNSETIYYINSNFNNNGIGLLAALLPQVELIWIEDGIIKFNPIPETQTEGFAGFEKVVGYRLLIDIVEDGIHFTTDVGNQTFKDEDDNICFDFSRHGSEGLYTIRVQAYIYYVNGTGTIFENAKTINLNDEQSYHRLLGAESYLIFEKIAAPSVVQIENGDVVWSEVEAANGYVVEVFTNTGTLVKRDTTAFASWWSDDALILPQQTYFVKVKTYAEGKVFSNYTTYCEYTLEEPTPISRLESFQEVVTTINTYTNEEGENFISFAYPSGGLDMGFNVKYRTTRDGEFSYVMVSDGNYGDIVTYLNETATINISKFSGEGEIAFMEYQIQSVPKGNSNYLKSHWSTIQEFSIPDAVESVYYDENTFEFFWEHVGSAYSYIVTDEIIGADDNCIAIFKYKIKSGQYVNENYYKERKLPGMTENVATISYLPSVVGYQHRVSVAVCLDTSAEFSLVSLFTQCEDLCDFDLFEIGIDKDILSADSSIYDTIDKNEIAQRLLNNAYGTALNPYLINNAEDFEKINLRLARYNYTYNYSVELLYEFEGQPVSILTNISESNPNYCFKQTVDLEDITQPIGIWTESGGTIKYSNFQNTYDGNNKLIEFNLTAPRTGLSLGLFLQLGNGAIVKNIRINAEIDFKAIGGSTFTYGAIAGRNDGGTITNCHVLSINVLRLVDSNNYGVNSLTFGGIVGDNKNGIVELCTTSSDIELILLLANSGDTIYAGGIAGRNSGTIKNSGNNALIDVAGRKSAYIGGVVGMNTGAILQVYNKAQVKGETLAINSTCNIGGIVGNNTGFGEIRNSYNLGNVSCGEKPWQTGVQIYLGGIVGSSESTAITNCYSAMSAVINDGALKAGTLAGRIQNSIPSSFGPKNIYINSGAIGSAENGGAMYFAVQVTENQLGNYANTLNTAAGSTIFENSPSYPRFIWESGLTI